MGVSPGGLAQSAALMDMSYVLSRDNADISKATLAVKVYLTDFVFCFLSELCRHSIAQTGVYTLCMRFCGIAFSFSHNSALKFASLPCVSRKMGSQ